MTLQTTLAPTAAPRPNPPVAAKAIYGADVEPAARPRFVAVRITADLAAATVALRGNGVPFVERVGRLIVPPSAACGVAIVFAGR